MRSLFVPNPEGRKRLRTPLLPRRAASHRLLMIKSERFLLMEDILQSLAPKMCFSDPQPLSLQDTVRCKQTWEISSVNNV